MDQKKIKKSNDLKNIRTYLSDMAETVRANEVSVIKVALAEQNKRDRIKKFKKIEGSPTKKIFWFTAGLILISASVYGSIYLIKQNDKNQRVEVIVKEKSLINYDEVYSILLNENNYLADEINIANNQIGSIKKTDTIKLISIKENQNEINKKISVSKFFSKMNFTAPSSLIRSFSDSYMVGSYTKNQNIERVEETTKSNIFMIFESKNYEITYAGMLDWEKTMDSDMLYLFRTANSGKLIFKDLIINNRDSRVLLDENNNVIFYYLFVGKNTLIITNSKDSIKEIITRLSINKIKPL